MSFTLTDEDFKEIAKKSGFTFINSELVFYEGVNGLVTKPNCVGTPADALKDFARAILRKEQEK